MTYTAKKISSNLMNDKIVFPLPPNEAEGDKANIEIFSRFMRYVRHVPNSKMESKILAAIHFTADSLDYSDAQVAKLLVDLGLRAPRVAFPADFLNFSDRCLKRSVYDIGGPNEALLALHDFWSSLDETGSNTINKDGFKDIPSFTAQKDNNSASIKRASPFSSCSRFLAKNKEPALVLSETYQ